MSENSTANPPPSPSFLMSVRVVVDSINRYVSVLVAPSDDMEWDSVRLKCSSRLNFQKQEFFEFSEQAVLSNLYWGIDAIEAALQADSEGESSNWLKESEKMLQVPVLLDEQETTAGSLMSSWFVALLSFVVRLPAAQNPQRHLSTGIDLQTNFKFDKVHPLDHQEDVSKSIMAFETPASTNDNEDRVRSKAIKDQGCIRRLQSQRMQLNQNKSIKSLQDVLDQSQSDTQDFEDEYDSESVEDSTWVFDIARIDSDGRKQASYDQFDLLFNSAYLYRKLDLRKGISGQEYEAILFPRVSENPTDRLSKSLIHMKQERTSARENLDSCRRRKGSKSELMEIIENAVTKLCFSDGLDKSGKGYAVEITSIYRMLNNKQGVKYTMLKDMILEQLLIAVSTSEEETVIRASVSILTTIVSVNISVIDDIKKGLRLSDLARALKCNVHEAATHIYLIKPSAAEIKTLECRCHLHLGKLKIKYVSQAIVVAPFIHLLQSTKNRAVFIALEFFHEVLRIPRKSIASIRSTGNITDKPIFLTPMKFDNVLFRTYKGNHENSNGRSMFQEEAMQVLFQSIATDESTSQPLSTFILSNIGGTYSGTGESYTVAWLVKKAGLMSLNHRNMIRNCDWLDPSLLDPGMDSWCSKIARSIIDFSKPAFVALKIGLKSRTKRVARESLTTIAWLRMDLKERLLACLCIYNYASGKGMKKLIHFSEGVQESFRIFSNVIWMADELHRVAAFYLPNKSVSVLEEIQSIICSETRLVMEVMRHISDISKASHKYSGAVNALIYYKGILFSGYSDGSIKVWDIKKQSATLVWDVKERRDSVTCFALFEPGETLLSGSTDKTIRVWDIKKQSATLECLIEHGLRCGKWSNKLECIEVIATKEPVQKLETYGQMIFVITQGRHLKNNSICKSKSVKCMKIIQGRIYAGCTDSSIQEISSTSSHHREIKAAAQKWRMQSKRINSITIYRDWLYCSSPIVKGSNIREWRRNSEPQMSLKAKKRRNILAMEVVEDCWIINLIHYGSLNPNPN
ncbi:putative PP1/PP2A phosphatases pleiotropic regulator PRL1 [Hibiscus syriacus]|uniref:PP1/PP2A phosphatases pleiotropic regulator PRL1 n=1 Tax=Hibiscus syriacus TaxID=106335 RepID=A0A6A2X0V2_HIBSY|nr:putative PP1/PP2A phosphatases pleiotropic regulator PRL1 [Hibiscus syriacus]